MSGQWEVVGKRKDKGNKILDQKSTKETNKKKAENLNVRVEEVLAKSQVKNLYSNDKNKENKPLEKKTSEVANKKPQKKEKSQDLPKPKAPKSLESALNNIDVDEFKEIFEKTKLHFPDASIVWAKELSQFLNQKLGSVEIRDPVFGAQSQKYPINIVPSGLKAVIEKATTDLDKSNRQLFFDISLTSMATDMSKNLPAMGHKLFLQHIALSEPNLVVENLTKHSVLRNSYQNRPNIGLSILWAVGQAGVCDFQAGFKVFQELMLPLIEMKSYSRFIFQYLSDLLTYFKNIRLTKEQHQLILEAVFLSKKNFPSEFRDLFVILISNLKGSIFDKRGEALSSFVDFYFPKIATCSDNAYQDCVCDVITECFSRDQTSLENWPRFYNKNVTSSAILLRHIEKNWETICKKFNRKSLLQALNEINLVNEKLLLKKRKEDSLSDAVNSVKNLLNKMTHTKKTRSPFKFLIFTFFVLISGFVYFDIKQQGDWQKSNTRKFLENSGICEHSHKVLHHVKRGVWWVDERIEENFPGYHKVMEASEPYVELSRNLGRIFYNIAMNVKEVMSEKFPVIVQSIESYAPGLVEHSQNAVSNVWSSSVFYVNRSLDYLKKEVFVGQLSPENMQRVVFEALNTTQIKAAEYYHWLYEKVQTTIK